MGRVVLSELTEPHLTGAVPWTALGRLEQVLCVCGWDGGGAVLVLQFTVETHFSEVGYIREASTGLLLREGQTSLVRSELFRFPRGGAIWPVVQVPCVHAIHRSW